MTSPKRTALSYTIRSSRQKQGMTQAKVAKLCGVTTSNISHYETGRCAPSVKVLNQLANIFHTTVDHLLEGTPKC
jgi:transcriptional regulator with XRE-family HTH domain